MSQLDWDVVKRIGREDAQNVGTDGADSGLKTSFSTALCSVLD